MNTTQHILSNKTNYFGMIKNSKIVNLQIMRTLLFAFFLSLISVYSFGQAVGDYRSVASTNWNVLTTWERCNSIGPAVWATPTAGQGYPGQNAGTGAVTIRNGHTVTLNESPANNIGGLIVGEGLTGVLQYTQPTIISLSVTTDVLINTGAQFNVQNGGSQSGSLTIGGTLINNGTLNFRRSNTRYSNISINGTSISGNGAYTFNTLAIGGDAVTWSSASTINIYGNFLNNTATSLDINAGTFYFDNGGNQSIGGTKSTTFNNLTINNADITINRDIIVSGIYTMNTAGTTFNLNAYNLTINGSYVRTNGSFIGNAASNLVLNCTASDQNLVFSTTLSLNNLTINNLSSSYFLTSDITVGSFTPTAGLLQNDNNTRTFTVNNDITIAPGFTLRSNQAVTVNPRTFTINTTGSFINNGITDLYHLNGANHSIGHLTFIGAGDVTLSGTGTTTDFGRITVNKGTTINNTVDVTIPITLFTANATFTQSLFITNGTFKLSSASNILPYYGSPTIFGNTGRLWLNNTSASIGWSAASYGNCNFSGTLKIDAGTFNIGNGDKIFTVSSSGIYEMSGGILNVLGRIAVNDGSTFTMTGGDIIVDPQNGAINVADQQIVNFIGTSIVNFTGGKLTVVDPLSIRTSLNPNSLEITGLASSKNFVGSTIQFGDGVSSSAGNAGFPGFCIYTANPIQLGNLIINNPAGTGREFIGRTNTDIFVNDLTITTANDQYISSGRILDIKGNFINNGVLDASSVNSHLRFTGSNAQSYSGTGTATATIPQLTFNNTSATGVTMSLPLGATTVNLTDGNVYTTSANLLTVYGTPTTSLVGFGVNNFVVGPIRRYIAPGASANYVFPVGNTELGIDNYRSFEMIGTVTGGSGTGYITAEAIVGSTGGTGGVGIVSSLNAENTYWEIQNALNTVSITTVDNIQLTYTKPPTPTKTIGQSNTGLTGVYNPIGGTQTGTYVASDSLKRINPTGTAYLVIAEETPDNTWYSLISGDWDSWETWTLDPSGALPINPGHLTPSTSPTSTLDDVVIINGKTVTINPTNPLANNKVNDIITVNGRLDINTTTGHSFNKIRGTGRILLQGDNFPAGDATHFVTEGQGEGTVVYQTKSGLTSYNLSTARTFFNVEVELFQNTDIITQLADYTINGSLTINKGAFQINDNTSTTILNLTVAKDVLVESTGSITVGTGNTIGAFVIPTSVPTYFHSIFHQFKISGNFTNNGIVKLTNLTAPDYNSFATNGAVTLTMQGTANNTMTLNNTSWLYNLIIDKGVDKTYILDLYSANTSHFVLFGPNSVGRSEAAPFSAANPQVRKALFVKNGTLKLTGNILIPTLSEGQDAGGNGDYAIGQNARLWIAGANVTVYSTASNVSQITGFPTANGINTGGSNQAMSVYGEFKISSGFFGTRNSAGFIFWAAADAQVKIEGGVSDVAQFRAGGGAGVASYVQTGGQLIVRGDQTEAGEVAGGYPLFGFDDATGVFNMSGGEILMRDIAGSAVNGFYIPSSPGNYSVTGGTIRINVANGNIFQISSTAPLYNLIIENGRISALSNLQVLNDFTLQTGTLQTVGIETYGSYLDLVPNNITPSNLYVGRNLTIGDKTVLDVWGWNGSNNSTSATLTFNGSSNAVFYIGDITSYSNALIQYRAPDETSGGPNGNFPVANTGKMHTWEYNLPLYNLIIDKPGATLSLAAKLPGKGNDWIAAQGAAGNWVNSNGGKNVMRWMGVLLSITNQVKLLNGTFNQIDPYNTVTMVTSPTGATYGNVGDPVGYSINLYTTDIENRGRFFEYVSGVTPKEGILELRAPSPITIQSTDGAYFGNIRLALDNPITIVSDIHFGRIEYFNGTIDISTHNMKVDEFEFFAVAHAIRLPNVASGQPVLEVPHFVKMSGNESDGGLSMKVPKTTTWPLPNLKVWEYMSIPSNYNFQGPYNHPERLWFPIGTGAGGTDRYTPAICHIKNTGTLTGDEYITVRVVDKELQTTNLSGGDILSYYWNVDFEGYATGEEPTVSWLFQYVDTDVAGTEANYIPGKVLDGSTFARSDEGGINAVKGGGAATIEGNILGNNPRNIIIFNGVGTSLVPVAADNIEAIASTIFNANSSVLLPGTNINANWQNAWANIGFKLEKANYTAGVAGRFTGSPRIFYTRTRGDGFPIKWNNGNNWTFAPNDLNSNGTVDSYELHDKDQPVALTYPVAGDIAVIGWIPWGDGTGTGDQAAGAPHGICADNAVVQCAVLKFNQMLDASGNPTSRFYSRNFQFRPTLVINSGGGGINAGTIIGEGMFWIRSDGTGVGNKADPSFTGIDIGDFVSSDSSYFVYESTSNAFVYNNIPAEVPNLLIAGNGWGSEDRDFTISTDLNVRQNFELLGDVNLVLSSGATGDVTVGNNLRVFRSTASGNDSGGNGEIAFPNNVSRTVEVFGDVELINSNAILRVRTPDAAGTPSNLIVHGNLLQNNTAGGGFQLYTAAGQDYINLTLKGSGNHNYTVSSGTTGNFYNLTLDKGTSQNNTFTLNSNCTINGPTSGVAVSKAITLKNGKLVLNNPSLNLNLTTGNDNFVIPATAALEIRQGRANATGNSGIFLNGLLEITGGTLDMSGGNNFIEYTSDGNSTINITSGSLTVGSQIRRQTTTEEGILKFTQTGGTVILSQFSAPQNNRGVLEILNAGSSFTQAAGAKITIANAQTAATFPAVYLAPETYSLGLGSEIQFGNANTKASQTIGLYSNIPLQNISTNEASALSPKVKVKIWYQDITFNENVSIAANTELNSDGWNITVKGNWTNNGTYTPAGNITYFSGNSTQDITGTTTFYDFKKTANNTVNINNNITVLNEFHLLNGTLADRGHEIMVYGNLFNNGIHDWGNAGNGISMLGTLQQVLESTGTWGKISINNPNGVLVNTTSASILIDDAVNLIAGVFDIGKNLLVMKQNAVFIPGNPFSENNMVQPYLSFTDNGIKKYFLSSYSGILTFPIGSQNKYTPVIMNITSTGAGSIRVKAANEMHPTITEDTETCSDNIVDQSNVLKYHWILDAKDGLSGFNANVSMKYYSSDAGVVAPYTLADYLTAKLILGSTSWNKFSYDDFDEANNLLLFSFTNADGTSINGDYTAGVEAACGGAIPDIIPAYISMANGDWTGTMNWAVYNTVTHVAGIAGVNIPTGGPRGAIAIIDTPHRIDMNQNYLSNYRTTINGILDAGLSFGQRLGVVDGTGELYIERGDLPAAIYDDFILPNTGTFHFGGTTDYDILSEMPQINNLKVSGIGQRRFPDIGLITMVGTLVIDGTDNTLLLKNEHNKKIEVQKDITFNAGSFEAGTDAVNDTAVFVIGGTAAQTISGTGSFTGSNAFNHFVMNNPAGLTLLKPAEIDQTLTFTNGIIYTDATNILTLNNTSPGIVTGAGNTKYVDGPLKKNMLTSGSFTFPIGNGGRYAPTPLTNEQPSDNIWEVQYFDANPITNPITSTPPSSKETDLNIVSEYEYWRVKGPASGTSRLQIRWDSFSILPAMTTHRVDSLKMVEWSTTNTQWEIVDPTTVTDAGINSGSILSGNSLNLDGDHYFTFGLTEGTPLPAAGFLTLDTTICIGSTIDLRVQFAGIPNFTIWVWDGSSTSEYNTITDETFSYSVGPINSDITYRIDSVSDNTGVTSSVTIFGDPVTVTVVPLPIPSIVPAKVLQEFCAGETTNYSVTNHAGNTYNWVETGGNILAGQGTNTVSVEWSTGPGDIAVTETTPEGCAGSYIIDPVTIFSLPTANDQTPASICSEVAGETVQITNLNLTTNHAAINGGVPPVITYTWYTNALLTLASQVPDPTVVDINDTFSGGINITKIYYCKVTNANNCYDVATVTYTIYRIPETGPQYHISNTWP